MAHTVGRDGPGSRGLLVPHDCDDGHTLTLDPSEWVGVHDRAPIRYDRAGSDPTLR